MGRGRAAGAAPARGAPKRSGACCAAPRAPVPAPAPPAHAADGRYHPRSIRHCGVPAASARGPSARDSRHRARGALPTCRPLAAESTVGAMMVFGGGWEGGLVAAARVVSARAPPRNLSARCRRPGLAEARPACGVRSAPPQPRPRGARRRKGALRARARAPAEGPTDATPPALADRGGAGRCPRVASRWLGVGPTGGRPGRPRARGAARAAPSRPSRSESDHAAPARRPSRRRVWRRAGAGLGGGGGGWAVRETREALLARTSATPAPPLSHPRRSAGHRANVTSNVVAP